MAIFFFAITLVDVFVSYQTTKGCVADACDFPMFVMIINANHAVGNVGIIFWWFDGNFSEFYRSSIVNYNQLSFDDFIGTVRKLACLLHAGRNKSW